MSQFATVAQLEARIGESIGNSGQRFDTATQLLQHASALIQNYTGQTFDSASAAVETFDAPGTSPLFLQYVPVNGVASVTQDGNALTVTDDFNWYANGVVERTSGTSWGTKPKSVVVAYSHGYTVTDGITAVPGDVKAVCLEVVARAVTGRPVMHRATGTADSEGNPTVLPITDHVDLALSKDDKDVLDRYRIPVFA